MMESMLISKIDTIYYGNVLGTGKVHKRGGELHDQNAEVVSQKVKISDSLTLSPEARSALKGAGQTSAATGGEDAHYYAQFFPTRSGEATIFGENILDPGKMMISKGLTPSEIAQAARKSMDAQYADMAASGRPYDVNSWNGIDDDTLMSGLDRAALAAVASNQDSLFTQEERNVAQSFMSNQQAFAMGLYEGPLDMADKWHGDDLKSRDLVAETKKNSAFLDKATDYEKGTAMWLDSRATAQWFYENEMDDRGLPYDPRYISKLDAVTLLDQLMKAEPKGHMRKVPTVMGDNDLLSAPWVKGHEAALKAALHKTRVQLGLETETA